MPGERDGWSFRRGGIGDGKGNGLEDKLEEKEEHWKYIHKRHVRGRNRRGKGAMWVNGVGWGWKLFE